jgi:hypothetical protein
MPERQFSHYRATVVAGPAHPEVIVDVVYTDVHGEVIGIYGQTMVGFACTWRDVAEVVRDGLRSNRLDLDPCKSVSPMVDLT